MSILSKLFQKRSSKSQKGGVETIEHQERSTTSSPIPFYNTNSPTSSTSPPNSVPSTKRAVTKSPVKSHSMPLSVRNRSKRSSSLGHSHQYYSWITSDTSPPSRKSLGVTSTSPLASCYSDHYYPEAPMGGSHKAYCDSLEHHVAVLHQQLKEKDAKVHSMQSKYLTLKKEMKIMRLQLRSVQRKMRQWNYEPQQISEEQFLQISVTPASGRRHEDKRYSHSEYLSKKKEQSMDEVPGSTREVNRHSCPASIPRAWEDSSGEYFKEHHRVTEDYGEGKESSAEPGLF